MTAGGEITRPVGDECSATLGWVLSVGARWREMSAVPAGGWGQWLLVQAFGDGAGARTSDWARRCDRALGVAAVLWGADEDVVARWARHPTRSEAFAEAACFALQIRDRDAWAFAHARNAFWRVRERHLLGWPTMAPRETRAARPAREGATVPDQQTCVERPGTRTRPDREVDTAVDASRRVTAGPRSGSSP